MRLQKIMNAIIISLFWITLLFSLGFVAAFSEIFINDSPAAQSESSTKDSLTFKVSHQDETTLITDEVKPSHFEILPHSDTKAWRGFRGTQRHAQVKWLPEDLKQLEVKWSLPMNSPALAGLVADENVVITSGRNAEDTQDLFQAVDVKTGKLLWTFENPCSGKLDYGNSPRATPWLSDKNVFVLSAFGQLASLDLKTGKPLWQKNLVKDFQCEKPPRWGYAGSPLLVENKLIVQPGAGTASIVAINPENGEPLWKTPGPGCAYGSLIAVKHNDISQIIGYDQESLSAWDLMTGKILWRYNFESGEGNFVSTPVVYKNKIISTDDSNGIQLIGFDKKGIPQKPPLGILDDFRTQTHTPVLCKNRLYGIFGTLFIADLERNLKEAEPFNEGNFDKHASIIASEDKLLIITTNGKIILLDTKEVTPIILGRTTISESEQLLFSYPALVQKNLYLRTTSRLLCLSLGK